jgi:hypothetical protein
MTMRWPVYDAPASDYFCITGALRYHAMAPQKENMAMNDHMKTARYLAPLALALAIVGPHTAEAGQTAITKCETINSPGSYILEGNLTTSGNCLTVNASFVTIILNGFVITGPNQWVGTATTGITVGAKAEATTIDGPGVITSFNTCANLETDGTATVYRITTFSCGYPLFASGLITNNNINCAGGSWYAGEWGGQINNNVVNDCHSGITVQAGSNVTNNTINRGGGANNFGLSVDCPSLVTNNAFYGYPGVSISTNPGYGPCVLTNNVVDPPG